MSFKQLCTGHTSPLGLSRRGFLNSFAMGAGGIALSQLLRDRIVEKPSDEGLHHAAKAKRVIFLFQAGAPSQMDLFDYKPKLNELNGQELPESVRKGQRLTAMSGNQASLPLVGSPFKFSQHGESRAWASDLMPHTAKIIDDLCFIKSMHTEAINHGPGVTFIQTGSQFPGRPSIGSWLSYGLGNENENLPSFVVMVTKNKGGQPLFARLWGNGFLESRHQGVRFRSDGDPVLYLNNPAGIDDHSRSAMIAALKDLHELKLSENEDPLIESQIAQYEMACRMQTSIPDIVNLKGEPQSTFDLYGEDAKTPGTFAANCLTARRLIEKGVRFVQLYHQGWDQHDNLPAGIRRQCLETDRASAALVQDLKQRGLLDDTLVIWGGEFGRTNYCQGKLTHNNFGRDHHPRCFTIWMAGGGTKPGVHFGSTDELGYNVVDDPVHIHDLQATILHLLGIDHERLTYKFQGRRYRLTDVHGEVVKAVVA